MEELKAELCNWLDGQHIDGNTIGTIRRRCFMPWDSKWNSIVRDETAAREKHSEEADTEKFSTVKTTGEKAPWPCQATDPVQHTDAVGGEGCKATTSEIKP